MRNINGYTASYNETNKRIDYLKYGLLNEYGPNLNKKTACYNEEEIIKKK